MRAGSRHRGQSVETRHALIVESAVHAFALAGFHRTQMADIARRANVALGTLYNVAPSKEGLFAAALLRGVGLDSAEAASPGTVRDVEAFVAERLAAWFEPLGAAAVHDALFRAERPVPLGEAMAAVYDAIASRRLAIRILDRSAHDLPRLNELFVTQVRAPGLRALVEYLVDAQASGLVAPIHDARASARFVLETCAWFAMHRLFSPGGADISDDVARRTALTHLVAAFALYPPAE